MRISDVLRSKGADVITTDPDRTLLEVVRTLVRHDIGATVVVEEGRPVGIVSERDILRLTARAHEALDTTRAEALMTRDLVTASPEDDLDRVMNLMTNHRVRHLPILEGERLVGIVSIGDVVNRLRSESEENNRHLMAYIAGH